MDNLPANLLGPEIESIQSPLSHHLLMSTPDDIHADPNPNCHADRVRRPSMECSSGTVIDGNNFYFSEIDSDAVAEVELECGESELNSQNNGEERGSRCRICQSISEGDNDDSHGDEDYKGVRIELGCSCIGDLAVAHKHCAETWFKVKGNSVCEICGAIALNSIVHLENEGINIDVASQVSEAGFGTNWFRCRLQVISTHISKPNDHADGGDFCSHQLCHVRRLSIACSSGTVTDDNFYFSETDSDTITDGWLPVALTD